MSSSPAAEWEEPAEAHAGEVRKLSTLLEASQALSATLDLKESLQRVLEILGRHHGAIRSTVVLLNENTGDVELEAASGAITAKRVRYRVGEGITGKVVQTGKPMVVPRVSREPMFLSRAAERPELPGQELSYISAPIGLEGKTVGAIVTDDHHTRAVPRMPETNAAMRTSLLPALDAGRVPVLGGFVGATVDGHTTTLGRGGSDYSGALVGAGVDAREIQIWTDVDGMLTADPRVIASPRLVPALSFAEAAELAYFGAKVLHPSTILPAVERNIPVRILNSRKADAPGTLITADGTSAGSQLTALACKRDVTVVDITSSRMLMAYGFLRRVFEVFEQFRTAVDVVTTSEVSVSVTVDDRRHLDAIVEALREYGEVAVEPEMALLCAVGDRLRNEPEIAARVVAVLEEVPLRMISQAASRRNITVVMRQADLPHAMDRLHGEFFG